MSILAIFLAMSSSLLIAMLGLSKQTRAMIDWVVAHTFAWEQDDRAANWYSYNGSDSKIFFPVFYFFSWGGAIAVSAGYPTEVA